MVRRLPSLEGAGISGDTITPMGLVLAGLGVLLFSFSLPMTKIAVRGLDPTVAAVGRAAVASVFAAIALLVVRPPRPSRSQVGRLVLIVGGVIFGFPVLIAYALRHTASLHGSVVNGLLPLATAGLAVVRAGERPSSAYWACSAVGFAAVVAYVVHEGGGTLHAADTLLILAVLAAAIGYAEGALLSRQLGGWQVICWALVLGAPLTWIVTIVAASHTGLHATAPQWAAFGYTAVFSMFIGFFAWYAGMARAGIAKASQVQLLQPALSMVWGWMLLSEHLSMAAVFAIVVVLGAVVVGRTSAVHTSQPVPAAARDATLL
jgi:drug/metabolite transporter (DMT)-like permease